jgi:hypothetical protein
MTVAVITPSYAKDFDRCKLLCKSIDQRLKGHWKHYILVDQIDVALFSQLAGDHRVIISERTLFPWWLRSFPDPISSRHSRMWITPFAKPMRGWHAQQFRRFAIARHITEDLILTIDSDVVMLKDFDIATLETEGRTRFYRLDDAFTDDMTEHLQWSKNAGNILGISNENMPRNDYITTFITTRRDTTCAVLDHIEKTQNMHWIKALTRHGQMSECQIYGRFVDEVQGGKDHKHTSDGLCHVLWNAHTIETTIEGLRSFASQMEPHHVALGIQSFVGIGLDHIESVLADFKS